MPATDIIIKKVESGKELKQFINLPWKIYKNNPNWVPPLKKDVKLKLNREKHPFFEHAVMEMFLAVKHKEVIGRIAAVVDDRHNEFHNEKMGFFGMFECVDDEEVAGSLYNAAEEFCKSKGMEALRGPVNLSMGDECGLLIEGFDRDPVIMMPYNPEYYLKLFDVNGFTKAKDLYAYLKGEVGVVDRIENLVKRVRERQHVKIRPMNMKKYYEEVQIIKDVYNSAWELNWGFVPMTSNEMDLMAKELKAIVEPQLALIAEVDGQPVGISITLPDFNSVLKKMNGNFNLISILKFLYYKKKIKGLRGVIFGLKKEYRRTGINTVLYYETEIRGAKLGYEWCEMSWNLEDNDMINKFDEAIGGKLYKRYRIYERKIN
jgi:GNAT superfamily N-acetyltransferase